MPDDLVLDDGGIGYAEFGSGWSASGLGGFGGSSRFHLPGAGGATASWSCNGLVPGMYQVTASWTAHANRASSAEYLFRDGVRSAGTAIVDQRQSPQGMALGGVPFQFLGVFPVASGSVQVSLTENSWGVVSADAVRVKRVPLGVEELAGAISTLWKDAVLSALADVGFLSSQQAGAFGMSPATRLDQLLRAEGIPISGVSINPTNGTVRIDYLSTATVEQRTAGDQIASRLDLRAKRSRKLGDIATEVASLPQQELLRLLVILLSEKVQADPYFAFDRGLAIVGEEVDPNPPPPIV